MQSDSTQPALQGRTALIWIVTHTISIALLSIGSLLLIGLTRDTRIGQLWTPSLTFVYGLLGCLQGVLLRTIRVRIPFWFTASILGGVLAGFADAGIASLVEDTLTQWLVPFLRSAIAGTLVGICQWFVLRRHGTGASIWIIAMAFTGLVIVVAQIAPLFFWCAGIGLIIPGAVIGSVTGAALATILNQMILDKT